MSTEMTEERLADLVSARLLKHNAEHGLCFSFEEGADNIYVTYMLEHEGGLDGFYCDTYKGTIYVNNIAYAFELVDTFSAETIFLRTETAFSSERDPDKDLRLEEYERWKMLAK